jgi:Flp pilus assembly protein TadG
MSGQIAKTRPFAQPGTTPQDGENEPRLTVRIFSLHKLWGSYRIKRGAAAVEFAIVAPLFFMLLFGMIEYGRCVLVQQMLTNASREGARRGVLDGTTTQDVTDVVTGYLASASVTGASVTVNPSPPSSAQVGDPVTVTVQVPFRDVSWLPTPMFLGDATLSATSVMRRESVQ